MRTVVLILACLASGPAIAQLDSELTAYVAGRRKVMDDPARSMIERESVALEIAATLDRAAGTATTPAARRAAWSEARALLDGFSARNPDHPKARLFGVQAAVYLWAEGKAAANRAAAGDPKAAAEAAAALDGAADRLRPIVAGLAESSDPLAQNARYRLAQALLDRARLDPDRPGQESVGEALKALESRPFTESSLVGFVELLRADLLVELGQYDRAKPALDAARKASAPPSAADLLAVSVSLAAGRGDYEPARAEVDSASLPTAAKDLLRLKLALAERAALAPGLGRVRAEGEAFVIAARLKATGEAQPAIRALARAIEEPASSLGPDAWLLLAEGAAGLGQADRASRLNVIAADKADSRGDRKAGRDARFRAAAIAFGAGRFARAGDLFSRILADPEAGDLRPRAGMLRALARGRGLAAGDPKITRDAYIAALSEQIRDFPSDPATGEARWLLGRIRLEDAATEEAESLWNSVPREHARWLDARLAMAALRREHLLQRRLVDDPARLAGLHKAALDALKRDLAATRDEEERLDFDLEQVRLDLIPGAGDVKAALAGAERLRRLPFRGDQREQAEALRVLALVANERSLDAERAAGELSGSIPSRLILARDLDRWAAAAKLDRVARRVGGVERIVADRLAATNGLSPSLQPEVRLRRARGRMLAGDLEGARAIAEGWKDPAADLPGELADVADLLAQVGDPSRAQAAYRRLAKETPSGSPRWLAAKLGQARALFAAGQVEQARRLIDGTALLHPDLGGPAMAESFATLRAKVSRP